MANKATPWRLWGDMFKQFRLRAGYASQTELADALSHLELAVGTVLVLSTSQISRWENGQRSPSRREQHLTLIEALVKLGGIQTPKEANAWLGAGNRGMLTTEECQLCFGQIGQQKEARPQASVEQEMLALVPAAANAVAAQHKQLQSGRHDWGDAPRVTAFHGRQTELAQLKRWLVDDGCHLVTILGMGGVGKTALAAHLARSVAGHFDGILWRSLLNAPPLDEMLRMWLHFLTHRQPISLTSSLDERLRLLMHYLREQRTLLVLDNCEAILQAQEPAGQYLPGYADYSQLLTWMASQEHQSCLLLTSRERPHGVARLEREHDLVRGFDLPGLAPTAGRALIQMQGVQTAAKLGDDLVARYSGNPLALKLVADTIRDLFGGDVAAFLDRETPLFDDIRVVLDEQFGRLSRLERDLVIWLAVEREPLALLDWERNLVEPVSRGEVLAAVRALQGRSLLEQKDGGAPAAGEQGVRFALQNVVTEYATERLLTNIYQEVLDEQPDWLNRFALLKAQAKEHVRQSQERLLVQPLARRLIATLGRMRLETTLQRILERLRTQMPLTPGYAAGNILNLLLTSNVDVRGYDFSHLAVWQAYLRGKAAKEIDFSYADLSGGIFTDTFSSIDKVMFSPDGAYLAVATGTEIRLWQTTADGPMLQPHRICVGHTSWVSWICFSPNGRLLASGSDDQTIRLWDTHTGSCLHTLEGHTSMIDSVSFSPDGLTLYSGSADQTMRQWDVQTGACLAVMHGHTHTGWWVSASLRGATLASCRGDQTVRLWNMQSGEVLQILQGHTDWVMQASVSPDGRILASASNDHTARLWDLQTGVCLHTLQGHTTWVGSVTFSADSRMVATSSEDQTARIWDVQSGACLHILQGHTQPVRSVSFSPNGRMVASGSEDQTVRLWDVQSGEVLQILQGYQNAILSVSFSPDGHTLVSGNEDRSVRLWDAVTGEARHTLHGHTTWVGSVCFSPDGQMVASGSDDQSVRLWDVRTTQCLHILLGHTARVSSVRFSPDGRTLASGGADRCVRLWDVATKSCLHCLRGHSNWVNSVSFSPDGRTLASSSIDWSVRLWDVQTALCLKTFLGHTRSVESVSFSPNERILASGSADQSVRIWDAQTGECLHILQGHTNAVRAVCFSADGRTLASAGFDHTVRLWDVRTGESLHILRGHKNAIESVSFSPDGLTLASGSADQTIRLWNGQTGECLRILRSDRPYERMMITGATGLVGDHAATLKALGAEESLERDPP